MNRSFMWLPKINSKFLLPLFIVFSNFWIYKILTQNILTGVTLAITSLFIILKPGSKLIVIGLLLLFFLQTQTTSIKSLVLLDNDEQRVQSERIRSYPLTYIDLGIKVIWLKPDSWIEKNNLVIAFSKLEENLFANLDLNRYFFGGFPRNKPEDFEKFPLAYLPIFVLGVFNFLKKKLFKDLGILFITPLVLFSFLGNDNRLGSFAFFPFFMLMFLEGIKFLQTELKNRWFYYFIFISIVLTFILQISYAKN